MTMTLDPPGRRSVPASDSTAGSASNAGNNTAAAERLQQDFAAVRVSFTWFGVRKTLTTEQRAEAAEHFGADGPFLSAAKKLLDTKDPAYRAVTSVRGQILAYWRGLTLPYPDPGVRLIRQDAVGAFDSRMAELRDELTERVEELDQRFDQLRRSARQRLGSLYAEGDYPASLRGLFAAAWDFPAVEPPEYLLRLSPKLYEQERARVAARFDEAVRLAEQAFTAEFAQLVGHLAERLAAGPGGERKVFRDSAVENLRAFFERFTSLNVRSSAELERLVGAAREALAGVEPQAVRDSESLRGQVAARLATVQATLDGMLVDQPRRRILRRSGGPAGGTVETKVATEE